MNIGIVTSWFERGAAYVSRQYLDALTAQHSVFIYCRGGERRAQGDPAWDREFVTWGRPPLIDESSAVDLDDFDKWLTARRIDCVFFNEQRAWSPVLHCARRKIINGAYVVHYREDTIPFFDCHDFVICNSRHHFDIFKRHEQALFIPWGTDLTRFRPGGEGLVSPGRVTFFHSAGMNPHRKGTDLVLDAFRRLRPGKLPAHLLLQSQVNLLENLPAGREHLAALQRENSVTFVDQTVPDLADSYRLGDVCVYPTRHEGLGLTIAESLASGLPILVTDQAPVSEHADGEVVRTIPVERRYSRSDGDYWPQSLANVGSLAEVMQDFIDHPEQVAGLKKQARNVAEKLVDWTKNAAGIGGFFAGLKLVEAPRKAQAVQAATEYERQHWRLGFRNWIGASHPGLIRAARRLRTGS